MSDPIFGGGSSPGLLGTGQYQVQPYNIDYSKFTNPLAAQSQSLYQQAIPQMLSATTGTTPQLGAAAQAAGPNLGTLNQGVAGMQANAAQLQQMAAGQGPSVAQQTANQQQQQNIANQLAALGSARGSSNPALAQYQAQAGAAQAGQQAANQAVQGRTSEEMGAINALGSVNSNIAGAGGQAAQLGNQINLANQQATNTQNMNQAQLTQQQQAQNTNAYSQYMQQLAGQNSLGVNAGMAGQSLGVQNNANYNTEAANAYNSAAQRQSAIFGGLAGGASSAMMMMSDRKLKQNVLRVDRPKPSGKDMASFFTKAA